VLSCCFLVLNCIMHDIQLQYLCIHPKLQVNTDYIRQAPVMNSDNLRLIKEDE